MRVAGRDRVFDLDHFPLHAGIQHRTLIELAVDPDEAALAERRRAEAQVGAARRRGGTGRAQVRVRVGGAVAVLAFDLDVVAVLGVELAVAMLVLREMAVGAVHPLLEVDVLQVHGLLEFRGIVERNDVAVARRAGCLCDRACRRP